MPMTNVQSPLSPWISARNLNFAHGAQAVLHDVDLDLYPGRHYIIAGPNGAGKSTLFDILANLRKPGSGNLLIMGKESAEYAPGQLARLLALAPQEFQLNFSFSIREVVAMGRRPYLDRWGRLSLNDNEIVDKAIRDLHLEAMAGKSVTALSGGERRRCVIARALAQTTPIILLDEPNAGLDIAQALSLMALARRLAESGALVITISHDLNLSASFGHDIIFLKDGRIVASGPMRETLTDSTVSRVYDTEARVLRDDFSGGLAVSFKMDSIKNL